jgi:hypothetical protein
LLLSFIDKYPSKSWDHRQSCEEALRRSAQIQRPRLHGETARLARLFARLDEVTAPAIFKSVD